MRATNKQVRYIKSLLSENTERTKLLSEKEKWKVENSNFLTKNEADDIIKRIG